MLAGTPNFMSPEQSKGLELDGRSDLFSLGCLMYRLITGRLPFGASTVLATLQAIQNDRPPSVQSLQPTCGDDLTDVTMALLEKQPANRPESAAQLVEILDNERAYWPVQINRYSAKLPTDDPVTRPRQISNARSNGNFFRWIFATIALGMLGFGGFLFGPQIIRVATDQGEVVIETNDPNVEIEILEGNKVIRVVDTKTNQSFNIRSGSYEIRATANSTSSEADQNVAFDVTPQRLIMKRGQQQIVTVTKTVQAPDSLASGDAPLGAVSPRDKPSVKDKELVSDQPSLVRYPVTTDLRSALSLLDVMLQDSDAQIVADERSGAIIVRGRKEDHDLVVETLAAVENVDEVPQVNSQREGGLLDGILDNSSSASGAPVYDGKDFEFWLKVAKSDRSTRTVADAIRACGFLAETVTQRRELYKIITTTARRYGRYLDGGATLGVGGENGGEYVMRAVLTAIRNQPPELAVDFVEEELKNGNSRSLQFCSGMLTDNITYDNVIAGDENKFKEAFAASLDVLLPLAMKTDPPVDSLIYTAGYLSREELLKLNPNLDDLVTKLFWEQTRKQTREQTKDSQNSYYVALLGQLAAYLRVDDEKIVLYLANQYKKSKSVEQTYYGDWYFRTLTSDTLTNSRTLGNSFQPIVGWHDKMRFKILLEILQTKLSEAAVPPAKSGQPFSNNGVYYVNEYKLLECLYVLLPKISEKERQQVKEKFVATKRDLPERFKSIDGQELDIENNLDALIAACDGGTEPTFIKIPEAKGSNPQGGYGGGSFGGGVF